MASPKPSPPAERGHMIASLAEAVKDMGQESPL
jgi:hypothetical protein